MTTPREGHSFPETKMSARMNAESRLAAREEGSTAPSRACRLCREALQSNVMPCREDCDMFAVLYLR